MTISYNFELLKDATISEISTRARLYRHLVTGAELLSLENDDENKCFGITFRTPPRDSTGLPHILEHSVLCGSEKYPAKDPFVQLAKGSLNTFLNAFTFPDKTVYPVASTNVQDLYNLIDVYIDAVLHPLLTVPTFQQEAWHYEMEAVDGPLSIKGVVYNEMRGAYSSPDGLLARLTQQALFPDTQYGLDSGGDPDEIPNLTYEAFIAFHRGYYHPSNARIFFYGDDDPKERLRLMASYLDGYSFAQVSSQVLTQPTRNQRQHLTIPYAVGSGEPIDRRGYLTVSWLLPEVTDPKLALSMSMLEYILIGTPASPLRKALIDSGLGDDLAGIGLENDLRQMYLSTGLKGIRVEDAERVEDLIEDTLARLVREGIEPEMVEAALNTAEFQLRENNTGSFPRGLSVMLRALRTWLYEVDPLLPVAFEAPLEAIKKSVAGKERYFEGLISEHLLGNDHRVSLLMKPDPELARRREEEERQRLEAYRNSLSREEREAIVENTLYLRRLQETPDPPEVLAQIPSLTLRDLDPKVPTIPIEELREADTRLLYHDLSTNGILYLDLSMDLRVLPERLLQYVPLFGTALTDIGTEDEDYVRLAQRIGRKTGGIHYATILSAVHGQKASASQLVLRSKATVAQVADLLDILRDILTKLRLDNQERFLQMVLEQRAGIEAGLVPSGHIVAYTRLRAKYHEAGWLAERLGGISYLFFLRRLEQQVKEDWPSVIEALEEMRRLLINASSMICNVTLDGENWRVIRPALSSFLGCLPRSRVELQSWQPEHILNDEALVVPTQVNFVAKGADIYDLGRRYHGSMAVAAHHLRNTWLWERIRVQGGAYGGFCLFESRSGIWSYLSYRDPNILRTIDVYDATGAFLRDLDLSPDELAKSIIGTIGAMDAYMLPDVKGFVSLERALTGETDEIRQQRRDEILSTTLPQLRSLADALDAVRDTGRVVVMGSPEAVQTANAERGNWLAVTPVM